MTSPYYADELVTLYLGDCREVTEWLAADVLVTDPPYGRNYRPVPEKLDGHSFLSRAGGIAGDEDTATRDAALVMWGDRPAVAFGDLMLAPPARNKLTMVYSKPQQAGQFGAIGGFRRDLDAIYLIGPWPTGLGGRSAILASNAIEFSMTIARRYGHPHAKPVDVMEKLIAACPPGTIADPFCGSGSTLVAARNLGRRAIGVEVEERYCETAARRLAQGVLLVS